jgi:basic membrane protein A and related proteins
VIFVKRYLLLCVLLVACFSIGLLADGKIAIVLDVGGRGDLSFNDMGFAGADRAATEFGLEVTEVQSASAADYLPNFRNLARTGDYELILGIGFLLGDALGTVAAEYPEQKFAIIDVGWIQGPNIMNFVFRENEGAVLIGALAGIVAADQGFAATGIVLGIPIPVLYHFEAGYRFGQCWGLARYTELTGNEADVELLYTYTGTFDDIALGKAASEAMLAQGAVGIFNVAGPLGTGDHEAVVEFHDNAGTIYGAPFYFGVDANQDWFGQGFHALASCMKRVDFAAYAAVEAVMTDTFVAGVTSLGLAEGGMGISNHDLLIEFIEFGVNAGAVEDTQSARNYIVANWTANRATVANWIWDAVADLEAGILDGSIVVPTANSDGELELIRSPYSSDCHVIPQGPSNQLELSRNKAKKDIDEVATWAKKRVDSGNLSDEEKKSLKDTIKELAEKAKLWIDDFGNSENRIKFIVQTVAKYTDSVFKNPGPNQILQQYGQTTEPAGLETGLSVKLTGDGAGNGRIRELAPGKYKVEISASAPNGKTIILHGVQISTIALDGTTISDTLARGNDPVTNIDESIEVDLSKHTSCTLIEIFVTIRIEPRPSRNQDPAEGFRKVTYLLHIK